MRIAIVLAMFCALLAAALMVGGRAIMGQLVRAASDERDARRVGDIVYTMPDRAFCRYLAYDNTTGELLESAIKKCASDIAKGSGRRALGFAWGRR